ncbi:MAG: PAS domain-containing protein, partial [Bacilli bacterium]|nr:PAS domain-containing protein [Bacilli bacterium]
MDNLVKNAIHIDNETLFKNILDSIPNGVYATDTNRRIFYWNKKAEEITGYTSSEIIGKSCYTSNLDHMDNTGAELCKISCPLFDS